MSNAVADILPQKATLRPYQRKAIDEVFSALKEGCRKILLVLAMGLGKTTVMSAIIEMGYIKNRKILIIVHRDNLVRQFSKRLLSQFHVPSGLILGKEEKNYNLPIQVASRQSLIRRLDKFAPDHFDLIVVDEAHYAAAPEYKKILEHFDNAKLIGITATPFRADGKPLKGLFDKMIHPITAKEAIQQGYLVPATYHGVASVDMAGVKMNKKGEYDEGEMFARFSEWDITPHVVEQLKNFEDGPTIIFCINVAHTIEVYNACKAAGYKTEYVIGEIEVEQRNIYYEKFEKKQIQILVNCQILTEGADFPMIINVFLVKKMKSLANYLQMVGRGARTYQDGLFFKNKFNVVDFGGNVLDHGFFEDYDDGLTLTDGAAKKVGKKKPKKCPGCNKVINENKCDCGYVFEAEEKEKISIGKLEMEVLSKNTVNYIRLSKKKWDQVKDHELRLYAKIKGMKAGWALHQYAERHGIAKDFNWHIAINNTLSQLESEYKHLYE